MDRLGRAKMDRLGRVKVGRLRRAKIDGVSFASAKARDPG